MQVLTQTTMNSCPLNLPWWPFFFPVFCQDGIPIQCHTVQLTHDSSEDVGPFGNPLIRSQVTKLLFQGLINLLLMEVGCNKLSGPCFTNCNRWTLLFFLNSSVIGVEPLDLLLKHIT